MARFSHLLLALVCLSLFALLLPGAAARPRSRSFTVPDFPATPSVVFDHETTVITGTKILEAKTVNAPTVRWDDAKPGRFYTLVMIDPDAPSAKRPSQAQWLHWLVVNVPGEALQQGVDENALAALPAPASVRMSYAGPTPPPKSGEHRYVLYIFNQVAALADSFPTHPRDTTGQNRARWDIERFMQTASRALRAPIALEAGLFFRVEEGWDGVSQKSEDERILELEAPKEDLL